MGKAKTHLSDALEWWAASGDFSRNTIEARRSLVRVMERAGLVWLEDLDQASVAEFMAQRRRGGTSPASITQQLLGLAAILQVAVIRRRFDLATLGEIRSLRKRLRPAPLRARFLTRDEHERLLRAARAVGAEALLLVQIAVLAGLRASEIRRLAWEDVDLGRRVILVVEKPALLHDGRIKTRRERSVSIPRDLFAVLAAARPSSGKGWLFPRGDGIPTRRVFGAILARVRLEAELPCATFHVLRHTRASWLVQAGVAVAKVAKEFGHSVQICLTYYTGLADGYDPDFERAA